MRERERERKGAKERMRTKSTRGLKSGVHFPVQCSLFSRLPITPCIRIGLALTAAPLRSTRVHDGPGALEDRSIRGFRVAIDLLHRVAARHWSPNNNSLDSVLTIGRRPAPHCPCPIDGVEVFFCLLPQRPPIFPFLAFCLLLNLHFAHG